MGANGQREFMVGVIKLPSVGKARASIKLGRIRPHGGNTSATKMHQRVHKNRSIMRQEQAVGSLEVARVSALQQALLIRHHPPHSSPPQAAWGSWVDDPGDALREARRLKPPSFPWEACPSFGEW